MVSEACQCAFDKHSICNRISTDAASPGTLPPTPTPSFKFVRRSHWRDKGILFPLHPWWRRVGQPSACSCPSPPQLSAQPLASHRTMRPLFPGTFLGREWNMLQTFLHPRPHPRQGKKVLEGKDVWTPQLDSRCAGLGAPLGALLGLRALSTGTGSGGPPRRGLGSILLGRCGGRFPREGKVAGQLFWERTSFQ